MESRKRRRSTSTTADAAQKQERRTPGNTSPRIGPLSPTGKLVLNLACCLGVLVLACYLSWWALARTWTVFRTAARAEAPDCVLYHNIRYCSVTCVSDRSDWNREKWTQNELMMQAWKEMHGDVLVIGKSRTQTKQRAPTSVKYQETHYCAADDQYHHLTTYYHHKLGLVHLLAEERYMARDKMKSTQLDWRLDELDKASPKPSEAPDQDSNHSDDWELAPVGY